MNSTIGSLFSRKNSLRMFVVAVASSTLVACGGGGGGSTPDTTAPTVSVSPANVAADVARDATVTATFNEDMFATTIDGSSFTLSKGGDVPGSVTFDAQNNVATFTPASQFDLLATYSATLANTITDLAGNPLAATNWRFTTRDGIWGSPELIESEDTGHAWGQKIAFDANGNAIAVFHVHDGTRQNLWANRYVAGTGWGTPELIENSDVGDAQGPRITIDQDGNGIAVWRQSNSIWTNRYTAGTGWGSAGLITPNDANSAGWPLLDSDANGNAIAVWDNHDGFRRNLYASRYTVGTGWSAAEVIDNSLEPVEPQQAMSVSDNGNAMVVWRQFDGTATSIWANYYTVGSGWSTAEVIETSNLSTSSPNVTHLDSGTVLAGWSQIENGDAVTVQTRLFTYSSGWGTTNQVDNTATHAASLYDLASDGKGNAMAIWTQRVGAEKTNIWANDYNTTDGWGTATQIETSPSGNSLRPKVAFDSNGNALAVWQLEAGSIYDIWTNRYSASSGWGTATLMETDTGTAEEPEIAVAPDGSAIATWYQMNGTNASITASRFE